MRRFVPAVVAVLVMASVVVAIVVVVGSGGDDGGSRQRSGPGPGATAFAPSGAPAVLLAAGDIASCTSRGDEATAAILDSRPSATVATLGDNVYPNGTRAEFERCYGPSWGRHRSRTRPAPGNHDYATPGASGYFGYFGAAAGDPRTGYYSYDLGAWHVVVLNSNCGPVGCGRGSAQERWLRADLDTHRQVCTLAYFHHPRFSSGDQHGPSRAMGPLFEILYANGVDVVLAGHDHTYERFAPLDPDGRLDTARGIRSFVVGTGGRSHYGFDEPLTGSEVREGDTYGVLALDLHSTAYRWSFLPVAGESFTDSGTGTCH